MVVCSTPGLFIQPLGNLNSFYNNIRQQILHVDMLVSLPAFRGTGFLTDEWWNCLSRQKLLYTPYQKRAYLPLICSAAFPEPSCLDIDKGVKPRSIGCRDRRSGKPASNSDVPAARRSHQHQSPEHQTGPDAHVPRPPHAPPSRTPDPRWCEMPRPLPSSATALSSRTKPRYTHPSTC